MGQGNNVASYTPQQNLATEVVGEFYSPNISIATLKYITGYGRISWDLPIRVQYTPGVELGCHIVISNTTNETRSYLVKARAINSDGIIITEGVVLINGEQWFTLEAGRTIELPGSLTLAETDCSLELDLHEKTTDSIVSNCLTYLYSQEVELRTIYESLAAANIVSTITGLVTGLVPIMMIASMGVLMIKEAKK